MTVYMHGIRLENDTTFIVGIARKKKKERKCSCRDTKTVVLIS